MTVESIISLDLIVHTCEYIPLHEDSDDDKDRSRASLLPLDIPV